MREDVFHDGTVNVDGTIDGRQGIMWGQWLIGIGGVIGEVVEAAGMGAGFGLSEIRGITGDGKLHVTGMVPEDSIRVSGSIIKELCDSQGGCSRAFGLGGGDGAKGNEHSGVNGTGIVEKGANHFFDAGDIGGWKVSRCVRRRVSWTAVP